MNTLAIKRKVAFRLICLAASEKFALMAIYFQNLRSGVLAVVRCHTREPVPREFHQQQSVSE